MESKQIMSEDDQRATTKKARITAVRCAGLLLGGLALLPAWGASEVTPVVDGMTSSTLDRTAAATTPEKTVELWNAPGQFTLVGQSHPRFRSAYAGANSLESGSSTKETADLTIFLGVRLWPGAALYVNPEIDQGFGLSNTVGVAGFPSGEAYKVGKSAPYFRLNRVFVRQVFGLSDITTHVESAPNALGGPQPLDNITLTVGKLSAVDVFDTNSYAHDPRTDFLNWSIIDAGAFDYAADAWGYTYGAAIEWTKRWWTVRGGIFALSTVPNSTTLDGSFRQYSLIGELEGRHSLFGRPGKVKLLGFVNRGRMARYDDALRLAQTTGTLPDVTPVRRDASRSGVSLNLEQELRADLGAFVRASVNDGSKEAFEFTEINRSVSGGLSLKGAGWHRPRDTLGFAVAVNSLSGAARRYFAAGGLGILIGDGGLTRYATERIAEAYYSAHVADHLSVTLNFQRILAPAYNPDRGPVSIFGLRLHSEF